MRDEEENRVRRPGWHEIGQKLDDLSVDDLDERIAVLRSEIERLESAKAAKNAARDAAGSIFRL
jgi:uncharacterized small protein (DUF1192 family)